MREALNDELRLIFAQELRTLSDEGLLRHLRVLPTAGGKMSFRERDFLNFSSNNYLNLAGDERVKQASCKAIDEYGCGATASRLMAGTLPIHEDLEARLADMVDQESSLVFGSGFLTNLGVITSLARRGDMVFADRLNHASLVDGARLSGAKLFRYQHNDVGHLEELLKMHETKGRRLIVSDSVFSMDGDIAPLAELSELSRRHECILLIDEAHAIGVFGEKGGGVCQDVHVLPDFTIGTVSKALGGYGGFVGASLSAREILVNRARSFIYSTGLPPACLGSAMGSLDAILEEPDLGRELLRRAEYLRALLADAGLSTGESRSQIIPVIIGDNEKTLEFSRALFDENVIAVAVRPPTVPEGTSRLRFSITLAHENSDLEQTAEKVGSIGRKMGIL